MDIGEPIETIEVTVEPLPEVPVEVPDDTPVETPDRELIPMIQLARNALDRIERYYGTESVELARNALDRIER